MESRTRGRGRRGFGVEGILIVWMGGGGEWWVGFLGECDLG